MRVRVQGNDYAYNGEVVAMVVKCSGAVRYVVEDENGRLFIHNGKQIGLTEVNVKNGYGLDPTHTEILRKLAARVML
jgi:hypothetical protein